MRSLNFYLAKYLNGRGVGARYDGSMSGSPKVGSCTGLTGSASTFSSSYKKFLRQYWEAQVITYELGQGWIQWVCALSPSFNLEDQKADMIIATQAWKAELADEWVRVLQVHCFSSAHAILYSFHVVIPSRPREWMDPSRPYQSQIPYHLQLDPRTYGSRGSNNFF